VPTERKAVSIRANLSRSHRIDGASIDARGQIELGAFNAT
jgi:hypothetical protein